MTTTLIRQKPSVEDTPTSTSEFANFTDKQVIEFGAEKLDVINKATERLNQLRASIADEAEKLESQIEEARSALVEMFHESGYTSVSDDEGNSALMVRGTEMLDEAAAIESMSQRTYNRVRLTGIDKKLLKDEFPRIYRNNVTRKPSYLRVSLAK